MKLKTQNIIYYVSWKSCNNLIQILVHKALSTIQSSHTIMKKFANPCTDFCLLISCLHYAILAEEDPEWILICLALTAQSSLETPMCFRCIECITIVTIDSPSNPFTYLSTGSPLELTCIVVNYCICSVVSELLVVN